MAELTGTPELSEHEIRRLVGEIAADSPNAEAAWQELRALGAAVAPYLLEASRMRFGLTRSPRSSRFYTMRIPAPGRTPTAQSTPFGTRTTITLSTATTVAGASGSSTRLISDRSKECGVDRAAVVPLGMEGE